ncbi:MAG: YbhB/YbcL family Raf kinase inhibitor-like protein [Candidatus Binataceae bacterium]
MKIQRILFIAAPTLLFAIVSHGTARAQAKFSLTSPAFAAGATISSEYTCSGANRSPALAWTGAPAKTAAFVLIVKDPDAPGGGFIHWVAYNLPARSASLPAGVARAETIPGGGWQGVNSFGRIGYDGPCPPPGHEHRYHFRLMALDAPVRIHFMAQADAGEVKAAAAGHIIATAKLIGTFSR